MLPTKDVTISSIFLLFLCIYVFFKILLFLKHENFLISLNNNKKPIIFQLHRIPFMTETHRQ